MQMTFSFLFDWQNKTETLIIFKALEEDLKFFMDGTHILNSAAQPTNAFPYKCGTI